MFFVGGFNVMFTLVFVLVFGMILFTIIKGILQWNKNNHSPRLSVEATVVSKSGDRIEMHVSGMEYGMLVEGDYGKLTFQGTRYLDFVRM